jgi:hypothetical protein
MKPRVLSSRDPAYPWTVAWAEGGALLNQGFSTWWGAVRCALLLAYNVEYKEVT